MSLSQKDQKHPRFMDMSAAASDALVEVAARFDISEDDLEAVRGRMDVAVDAVVKALLRAYDIKHEAA